MADVRKARRDAEKAARDALSGTLVGTAGDLGVAHAARQDAQTEIETGTERGQEIVAAAQREAATLVKEAENSAGEGRTAYATAWTAARDAGWSQTQLQAMGYEKTSVPRKAKPAPAVVEPTVVEPTTNEPGAA